VGGAAKSRRCSDITSDAVFYLSIELTDATEEGAGAFDLALPHPPFSTTARRAYAIGPFPKGRFGPTPRDGDTLRLSPDTARPW
jgi:hypothetical protein